MNPFKFARSHAVLFSTAFLLLLTACDGDLPSSPSIADFPTAPPSQSQPASASPSSSPSSASELTDSQSITLSDLPPYSGSPYIVLEDNIPDFPAEDLTSTSFESYSDLDSLGRCGTAYACVTQETMPTEKRDDISSVHPSGWNQARYDFVDGQALYNRCHLIGFQLTGENANEENLITGTRYMNVDGMLPFEDMVADYVKDTGGRVLYRVTPIYDGDNLVASGVRMEGLSLEDQGASVCFDVYAYNVQPGVRINYADGSSSLDTQLPPNNDGSTLFILNTRSHIFHKPGCAGALSMSEQNRQEYTGERKVLLQWGYEPCGQCNP